MSIVYLNHNRPIITNGDIVEWDIRSANLSIIKAYGLLHPNVVSEIERLPKKQRNIAVGKIGQKDKAFMKTLEEKFTEVAETFISDNNLDQGFDILSIKKDAVFVVNRSITKPIQRQAIEFIPKNRYTGFMYAKPYEFYWTGEKVEVKGLSSELLQYHEEGILQFIKDVFILASRGNKKRINNYLHDFALVYKRKELPFDYYRSFDSGSKFKLYFDLGDRVIMSENIDESVLKNLDISYNYINIVLPIIRLFV